MTNGANGTETFVIRTVWMAFQRNIPVGLASAMAVGAAAARPADPTWLQRRLIPEEEVDLT